jgi:hypothetical protein
MAMLEVKEGVVNDDARKAHRALRRRFFITELGELTLNALKCIGIEICRSGRRLEKLLCL